MEEKSVFVEYFGDYPLIRVLDFLILGRDMDYSMTEICKNSGVGWTAFSEIWPHLIKIRNRKDSFPKEGDYSLIVTLFL